MAVSQSAEDKLLNKYFFVNTILARGGDVFFHEQERKLVVPPLAAREGLRRISYPRVGISAMMSIFSMPRLSVPAV